MKEVIYAIKFYCLCVLALTLGILRIFGLFKDEKYSEWLKSKV